MTAFQLSILALVFVFGVAIGAIAAAGIMRDKDLDDDFDPADEDHNDHDFVVGGSPRYN